MLTKVLSKWDQNHIVMSVDIGKRHNRALFFGRGKVQMSRSFGLYLAFGFSRYMVEMVKYEH